MIGKSHFSLVSIALAAAFLAVAPSASAQDINFICYSGSTVLLVPTGSTNQCMSNATLSPLDKNYNANFGAPLNLWSNESTYHPSGYGLPLSDDNTALTSYTNAGFTVTDMSNSVMVENYNEDQGNILPSLSQQPPPPSTPSLGFGSDNGSGKSTGTITVTGSGLFTFNAVDLLAYWGTGTYTITGYDGATSEFTLTCDPATCLLLTSSVAVGGVNSSSYTSISAADSVVVGNPNAAIDKLVIQVTDSTGFTRLDNIQLPEGGAGLMYLLLAAGACGGAMFMKRRLVA